jgi:DNA-binding FadR family transcriptional regulator
VLAEHRELLRCISAQDADGAARIIAQHVEGSGRHIIEHLRLIRNGRDSGRRS